MTRYIGVDLHTNSLTVCYFESEDNMRFKTYQLTNAGLNCFKQSLKPEDKIAVEAIDNTEFFVDVIESKVCSVSNR